MPAQSIFSEESPPRPWRGFYWSVPMGVLTAFSLLYFEPWAYWVAWMGAAVLLASMICANLILPTPDQRIYWPLTKRFFAGLAIMLILKHHAFLASPDPAGEAILKEPLPWPLVAFLTVAMIGALGWFLTAPDQRGAKK